MPTPVEGAAIGWMVGRFIYHRWLEDWIFPPKTIRVAEEFQLPKIDEGSPVPLIFGRCRVHTPILAWSSSPIFVDPSYEINMFFVLGIPFTGGVNEIHGMWSGDDKLTWNTTGIPGVTLATLQDSNGTTTGGLIQPYDGDSAQDLAGTFAETHMVNSGIAAADIPGYRGYISACLFGSGQPAWVVNNTSGSVPAYSFEASSYHTNHAGLGLFPARCGNDSNPINIIYDVLTGAMGKLGLPTSLVDIASFQAAQYKLFTESLGCSMVVSSSQSAEKIIQDVLRLVDGVLYEDPYTGKIGIKLIRNDFDPLEIPHITRDNCDSIEGYAAGGWDNLPNKIDIIFTNRDDDYRDNTATAQNLGAVDFTDFEIRSQTIEMRGCCTLEDATSIAERELAARSMPIAKCRAIVDRSFLDVKQGDAVKLTWPEYKISGVVFRVADVDRGTKESGKITLDLIQDYFYVWRNQIPVGGGLGGLGNTIDLPTTIGG